MSTAASAELVLELELGKSGYGMDEAIICTVLLVNRGEQPVTINRRLMPNAPSSLEVDLDLYLIGPDGYRIPFQTLNHAPASEASDFKVLDPGKSVDTKIDLSNSFELQEPGDYSLQAVYRNKSRPAGVDSPWVGEVSSQSVRFKFQ
jgi:hypothetical protein